MDSQEVIIPPTQKQKTNLLFPVFIFLVFLLSLSLIYFGYQISLIRKEKTPFPTSTPSIQPTACILGIKLDQCCSCPEPILKKDLSKNLVEYEPGKDYSRAKLVSCKDTVCSPCEPLSKAVYVQGQCQFQTEETANPDGTQTANWKTYTNPLTKYLLRHPQSWEVQEYPNADLPYIIHRLELLKNNKPQLVIETYREFLVKAVPEDKVIRSEQITISGVTGTKNWHNSLGPPVEIIVSLDAKTYRILLKDVDASQMVDKILSTFKFLE